MTFDELRKQQEQASLQAREYLSQNAQTDFVSWQDYLYRPGMADEINRGEWSYVRDDLTNQMGYRKLPQNIPGQGIQGGEAQVKPQPWVQDTGGITTKPPPTSVEPAPTDPGRNVTTAIYLGGMNQPAMQKLQQQTPQNTELGNRMPLLDGIIGNSGKTISPFTNSEQSMEGQIQLQDNVGALQQSPEGTGLGTSSAVQTVSIPAGPRAGTPPPEVPF